MKILTWNIQATKGCDDQFDIDRIVSHIESYGELDVICLQEVSRHIEALNSDDQVSILATHFSHYETVWAPGFSVPATNEKRFEFGNLTLVKRPLLKYSRVHSLPSPWTADPQTPRTMVEVAVGEGDSAVTIFNTHLAFHSTDERVEQIQMLTRARDTILANAESGAVPDSWGPYAYTNESASVILCGDLNVDSDSIEFKTQIADQDWVDCWVAVDNSAQLPRLPTCGCFDAEQWPQGPHVRDYFLATRNIVEKTKALEVDVTTNASDHQPVFLKIAL